MAGIVGLTLVKINQIFHIDVRGARWGVKRDLAQFMTGEGLKNATGGERPSGTFDEVIPKDKALDVRALKKFSIEIYDKETQSIVVAAFSRADWDDQSGSADTGSANTGKSWSWKAEKVVKI